MVFFGVPCADVDGKYISFVPDLCFSFAILEITISSYQVLDRFYVYKWKFCVIDCYTWYL